MSFDRFRLDGRVAVITGAAGLLGREHSFAVLDAGGHVVLLDVDENAVNSLASNLQLTYPNSAVIPVTANVADEISLERALSEVLDKLGRVDILINNAALNPAVNSKSGIENTSRLENFELVEWERQLSVGLTGAFLCAKVFGAYMALGGAGGVIVNISSDLSVIAPDQRLYARDGLPRGEQPVKPVTYSVIKTGLIGLTRYLATYWCNEGVRCNALSPGGVFADQPADFTSKISELIPMGRMAFVDEYRASLQYLCSDASSYMNGHNLVVDGGRSVL